MIERLFGLLGDSKIDNHQNWKGRFRTTRTDAQRLDLQVADVLKPRFGQVKSLSFASACSIAPSSDHLEVSEVIANHGGHRGPRRPRPRAVLDQGAHRRTDGESRQGGAAHGADRGARRAARAS
jgi:hypothetical protein